MADDPKKLDQDSRNRPPPGTPGGGPASTSPHAAESLGTVMEDWRKTHTESDNRRGQFVDEPSLTPNADRHPPRRPSTPDNVEPGSVAPPLDPSQKRKH